MSIIRIYCMAHKRYEKIDNDIYIPLQVGAAIHEALGYAGDNTGDNISSRNPYYSELTGMYWMYKNDTDCDITGLCHYRRYFLNEHNEVLISKEIENILDGYDIIVSEPLMLDNKSLYESYSEKHNKKDMDLTREAVSKLYPDYLSTFDEVINSNTMYFANMLIASKEKVNTYSKWLFDILFEVEKHLDMTGYDEYNQRVYGFIAERLLRVWILHNNYKPYECVVGLTESKVETKSAIETTAKLLKSGDYNKTLQYLDGVKEKRPDAFYLDSDIDKSLGYIYTFAKIMQTEEQAGMNNLCGLSLDYKELINVGNELADIIAGTPYKLYDYIQAKNLSIYYMLVMLPKLYENKEDLISIYNYLANMYLDHSNLNMAKIYVNQALELEQAGI